METVKTFSMNPPVPTEHQECVVFTKWLDLLKIPYFHIPNETFTRSWVTKRKNKEMGVKAGVPDYFILANNTPIFLEMKRKKGGVVSSEQKDWLRVLGDCTVLRVFVCKGAVEAQEAVLSVLRS